MTPAPRLGMLFLAAGLVVAAAPARDETPTAQLRRSIDEVLHIPTDPRLKSPAAAAAREAAVRRVVEVRFGFRETARRALGIYWRQRTPAERRRFTSLFRELLERSYIGIVETYRAERVTYAGESVDGDQATVRTRVATDRGDVPMDYRLRRRGDTWLVYDVLVERVSLVDNYRSQFRDVIATSSYGELVRRIEGRLRDLRASDGRCRRGPVRDRRVDRA